MSVGNHDKPRADRLTAAELDELERLRSAARGGSWNLNDTVPNKQLEDARGKAVAVMVGERSFETGLYLAVLHDEADALLSSARALVKVEAELLPLRGVLATLNGDGGQRAEKVGTEQAVREGLEKYAALVTEADAARHENAGLVDALHRVVAQYESDFDNEPPPSRPDWLVKAMSGEGGKLHDSLHADLYSALAERDELQASLDLRWRAGQRAIDAWRDGHPERALVQPDHVDLVVWLAADRDRLRAEVEAWKGRAERAWSDASQACTAPLGDDVDGLIAGPDWWRGFEEGRKTSARLVKAAAERAAGGGA